MMLPKAGPSTGQTCGLVLIFAVLLQTICVAVTFLYFTNELKQLQDTYSKSGIACLTGEDLGTFVRNVDLNENEERESDPCWQVKWQLGKIIKKMISRNYEENISSAMKAERSLTLPVSEEQGSQNRGHRIAAHLTGSSNKKSSLSTSNSSSRRGVGQKINTWESSRKGHSFLYNVELKNGELIIPRTGFYYIYSQTYFRFREPETEDSESDLLAQVRNPKQMVQYVYKLTTYPEPILLMKSARTSCWSKKAEYGLYSIYQGGVFQLKRHDKIFVSVSNEDMVDMDKEASFFGAFLIS
ncbi:tumor necrosis factor ligand superfamily member 10 isoform X1 [Pelodiscus sinensis]|uniref:Tumor necrosis factor ligand superfamily member 10 n=2 Tax=Pelodiscus sinensis TaxID=13735 RepID=K7FI21_PELSI|nr:tumor necrosis factor ligand superfamily member 10 isoform X1 [Pelodiscus sinensis]|eukprot:XP_006134688.1 tumor necrosis factor ligand superfamily member 10 isoform X1 [Pelodiscus sinensis]